MTVTNIIFQLLVNYSALVNSGWMFTRKTPTEIPSGPQCYANLVMKGRESF